MNKKEDVKQNVLGLLPSSTSSGSPVPYGLAVSNSRALTKTEERIVHEADKQNLVLALQSEKTVHALKCSAEIRETGADVFYRTSAHHAAINAAAQGTGCQEYVEAFNHHNRQQLAQNEFEIIQGGVGRILEEVRRPLYQEDVQPSPWQRLRGG